MGDESKINWSPAEDPEMDDAMRRARASFKYFWRELTWEYRRIVPGLELAAVKRAFSSERDPSHVEHMWLTDVWFDGTNIEAVLVNDPNGDLPVAAGDKASFPLEELEDWLYVMHGRAFGAYTTQLLRTRLEEGERRAHDEAWGFDFGAPGTVAIVPDWSDLDSGRTGDPDAEHPMSENMAEKLAEAIDANPDDFLHATDAAGLTPLHSLALGGSEAGVRVLLAKGANRDQRTNAGKTALDLAKQMGWEKVAKLLSSAP